MNCKNAEKWILLKDSGELSARFQEKLVLHIESCECCRVFSETLDSVKSEVSELEIPPANVVNNVIREARQKCVPMKPPSMYWKPAIALAASIMIALGLFFSMTKPATTENDLGFTGNDILELNGQIAGVMENSLSENNVAFDFLMTYDGI